VTLHIRSAIGASLGVKHVCTNCKEIVWTAYVPILDNCLNILLSVYESISSSSECADHSRNPTLSYTQRLEQKVAHLEAALEGIRQNPIEARIGHAESVLSTESEYRPLSESSRAVDDARVDVDSNLPLNGSISLFQLPSSVRAITLERTQAEQDVAANRETLVNSAWRERVFERLADTPVRRKPILLAFILTNS
jgi:hypothetical protein